MKELHQPRHYRLLAAPPFVVVFPSVTYRIELCPVTGAPQAELRATSLTGRPEWSLCRGEAVERYLYELGFELLHPTAASMILDRLCREGRAEVVARRAGPRRTTGVAPNQSPSLPVESLLGPRR